MLPGKVCGNVIQADLYLQDEMQVAFHPTLTRVWCLTGHRGRRLMLAPGDNLKVYGFGLVDWRDGWFDGTIASGRTADAFCEQVRAAVTRSKARVVLQKLLRIARDTTSLSLLCLVPRSSWLTVSDGITSYPPYVLTTIATSFCPFSCALR